MGCGRRLNFLRYWKHPLPILSRDIMIPKYFGHPDALRLDFANANVMCCDKNIFIIMSDFTTDSYSAKKGPQIKHDQKVCNGKTLKKTS